MKLKEVRTNLKTLKYPKIVIKKELKSFSIFPRRIIQVKP